MIYIITGTGTDVGKTIATSALACQLQQPVVVKPAQTGEPEGRGDLATLHKLTGVTELHEFARYPEPLAPATAARRAGMPLLKLIDVTRNIQNLHTPGKTVLVESAGGLLVELGDGWTIADLAVSLQAPVIVVTTTNLGSLNHAALTLEALHTRGICCAGLIGGSVPASPDMATTLNLEEFTTWQVPWLGAIPEGAGALNRGEFCTQAPGWVIAPRVEGYR